MNFKTLKSAAGVLAAALFYLTAVGHAFAHETADDPSKAPVDPVAFKKWLVELRAEASGNGIREEILASALDGVKQIPRVIELDRKQPEFSLTFAQYMTRVVPNSRVQKGRKKLAENKALLEEVGKKFGVQPRFIVAFWGIETDFGRVTGGFKLIPALATLAHDGRRSKYFRKELMNALKILNGDHIKAKDMVGSWAGAMGQCQFMPSSFLNFAIDYNGDGRKDIWSTKADVFGSAANYLSRSGWKGDQTWGRAVTLPAGFNPEMVGLKIIKPIAEWGALGVLRADGSALPARDLKASIVYTEGPGSAAYMIYNNYRTILKWNRSTYFAVAVGTLADRIGGS
ncbi:MAG: lytic murein transglycosylase [Rhodospirillaceae bacterium]|jgi:membrane-bound lytic murein transglycosylase B|nr:lytic murein transglycosylase [Rhodospirillaceae bacterium]MBT5245046.1 lytic murein transglycosylase [Rhodospirillaceae bacterium]MBT5561068.1 lytic murein transglycosylase [Rhodospirillaceae bacterium]MBT6242774.1 lytic murein transglycosylase [Rhodospirillaceae bacterium]